MTCRNFDKAVLALAREEWLDAVTRKQGLAHAETCGRCAARLTEERAWLAGVRAVMDELTADPAQEEAASRVEAHLLVAFHQQVVATASPALPAAGSGSRHLRRWQLAAVAAGLIIIIAALTNYWQLTHSPAALDGEQATRPVLHPADEADTPDHQVAPSSDNSPHQVAQPPRPRRRARPPAAVESQVAAEVVTEFFPLREGEDLSLLESAQIVRVELPGSALSAVGFPVDPEAASEPVKADLVLGHDGLARAIRFVR